MSCYFGIIPYADLTVESTGLFTYCVTQKLLAAVKQLLNSH